ncbi:MAG: manganese efflux pump MntP family protein [Anaerolineae bacterium]|jgi:putative Mn2+ efflux pump MntP|nr:manganese efflux pump MntP family protein [Anaerolineae bacterium]
MGFLEVLFVALGLAMDAFAVSLGAGATRFVNGPRPVFRLSFHFGLFQALMPVLGWIGGTLIAGYISGWDHWIAFALLAFVGVRMIRSGADKDGECYEVDPSRGSTLIMLSVATSIDAFAVGLSLAMLSINILYPAVVIGVVAAALSAAGLALGHRLGCRFGKSMEIVGGFILIIIGLRVVLSHTILA